MLGFGRMRFGVRFLGDFDVQNSMIGPDHRLVAEARTRARAFARNRRDEDSRSNGTSVGMIENGAHNVDFGADRFGFRDLAAINWNFGAPQLYEQALQRNEARIAAHGALVADTGLHTGRSPKDKFVVRDADTEAARLVGQQQCDDGRAFRRAARRLPRPRQRQDAVRSGSLRRRRSRRCACARASSPNTLGTRSSSAIS